MSECPISAYPVRIIPFDLGRSLSADDLSLIEKQLLPKFRRLEITPRQRSILKGVSLLLKIRDNISAYIYSNGICVIVVEEKKSVFRTTLNDFQSLMVKIERKLIELSLSGNMTLLL